MKRDIRCKRESHSSHNGLLHSGQSMVAGDTWQFWQLGVDGSANGDSAWPCRDFVLCTPAEQSAQNALPHSRQLIVAGSPSQFAHSAGIVNCVHTPLPPHLGTVPRSNLASALDCNQQEIPPA